MHIEWHLSNPFQFFLVLSKKDLVQVTGTRHFRCHCEFWSGDLPKLDDDTGRLKLSSGKEATLRVASPHHRLFSSESYDAGRSFSELPKLLQYFDDWLVHRHSREFFLSDLRLSWQVIVTLGLIPNPEKSVLVPSHDFIYARDSARLL